MDPRQPIPSKGVGKSSHGWCNLKVEVRSWCGGVCANERCVGEVKANAASVLIVMSLVSFNGGYSSRRSYVSGSILVLALSCGVIQMTQNTIGLRPQKTQDIGIDQNDGPGNAPTHIHPFARDHKTDS
jgi:hypothetical protein